MLRYGYSSAGIRSSSWSRLCHGKKEAAHKRKTAKYQKLLEQCREDESVDCSLQVNMANRLVFELDRVSKQS